jgi:hypothetical protein
VRRDEGIRGMEKATGRNANSRIQGIREGEGEGRETQLIGRHFHFTSLGFLRIEANSRYSEKEGGMEGGLAGRKKEELGECECWMWMDCWILRKPDR